MSWGWIWAWAWHHHHAQINKIILLLHHLLLLLPHWISCFLLHPSWMLIKRPLANSIPLHFNLLLVSFIFSLSTAPLYRTICPKMRVLLNFNFLIGTLLWGCGNFKVYKNSPWFSFFFWNLKGYPSQNESPIEFIFLVDTYFIIFLEC